MARAEEDLAHAVIVTVCAAEPLAPAREVAEVLAIRLGVEAGSLVLRQASNSSYLLVLPDIGLVERLVDQRLPPLRSPAFTLLCKRWSRLAGASGRTLPWLVDLELRGIPAHVWETSTVEQFLNPLACIQQVHPETLGLVNLASFRCSAWCMDPAALPPSKELWVVEPTVAAMEDPPVKSLLSYPIEIKCSILHGLGTPPPPPPPAQGGPPPAGGDGGDVSPAQWRRRRPSSSSPSSPTNQGDGHGGSQRRTILERVSVGHVVAPSSAVIMAASSLEATPEQVAGFQGTLDVQGSPEIEHLGSMPPITASPANGLKGPTDDSPAAANPFSSDDVAPSMISPMLVRFAVDEELTLPWAVSGAPGLAPHGPMDSPFGLRKKSGPSEVGAEVEDRSEATECLLASPCSPLCFFSGEATDLPASPRTPSSSPPIPEFSLLVTPPLCSQAPVKPLLVYSRRRFHHSRTPVGGEAAAAAVIPSPASLVGDVVAVTAAPPLAITLGDPATSTVTTPPAAATVPRRPQRCFFRWPWLPQRPQWSLLRRPRASLPVRQLMWASFRCLLLRLMPGQYSSAR
ncbi:uncharacterized protein [Miscanthus floridulus]|uniref:uncharacterized protein n=1 Tax=Miscanthus floridulus TaxID=154761 RepID=UPI003459D374